MAKIVETMARAGTFSLLVTSLRTAGLASTLKASGPFTIFAPDDDAFARTPPSILEGLLGNLTLLRTLLEYLVTPGAITMQRLRRRRPYTLATLQGEQITLNTGMLGRVEVNGAVLTRVDVPADNGIIQVIDRLILPASLRGKKG